MHICPWQDHFKDEGPRCVYEANKTSDLPSSGVWILKGLENGPLPISVSAATTTMYVENGCSFSSVRFREQVVDS